ncbi:NAD-dependent succinate-semialdehyde dehydrogenase [Leucobacter denitrificans]|uniref:NAD-dependent succinate-semialdehyde dehydrogenase n=1 Tax=Leucobacter denitrificans TaxID=683042 RepID=A0A7G9S540_9MICO|nr:NAD-dependent succinate-semialdehyde dehydrogenase [Leucobacter denitrificans]QNN62965.1 NAD-dependent succinate-semialdehyde dehydrogenase [Leucobacter denitrificans]
MSQSAQTIFINGQWREAIDGASFQVTDPSTGEVIGHASDGSRADADAAIAAAAAAFPAWSQTTAYQRAEILQRAHDLMRERQEELAQLMTKEQGKPLKASRNEVGYAADFLRWFAGEALRIGGSTIPSARADQRFVTIHQPVGVIAAITPWNYPISMITRKIGPALAAGCTSVLKPAALTPLCAAATLEIFREAGVPDGVINQVTTSHAAEVGDAFIESRDVRKITFTGSTAVGRKIAGQASEAMKRVSVELGGHAPFIVFPDADPVHAAKGAALVKFLNMGQACISPNRIYVHRSIYDTFLETLQSRVSALKVGRGTETGVSIGPLIDDRATAKMVEQVEDARGKGARVLTGGERVTVDGLAGENFYSPTVLADVTPDMLISSEETFGPIAAVTPFDTEEEVIELANDTEYGLAAYVYTKDLSTAIRVTEKLHFGMVGVNDINPTSAAAPFGGVKDSGLGREGGAEGIFEYLDVKLIGLSV